MTQWETIHDRSSHISPVRLVQTKNYSTERGNGIFEAVSKSFIPTRPDLPRQNLIKKPENKFRLVTLRLIFFLSILCLPAFLFWQCYTQEDSICHHVDTTVYTHKMEHVKRTIQSQVTRPFSNAQQVWVGMARHSVYTPSRIIQDYYQTNISPIIAPKWKYIRSYLQLWKREYNAYMNQKMDYTTTDTIIEEKVKKTAEWIREYVHPNKLLPRMGMRKEDADEKAQEIIRSIHRQ